MGDMKADVWQEVNTNSDGLSVTTYSQVASEAPKVEDESWWTWAELQEMKPEE